MVLQGGSRAGQRCLSPASDDERKHTVPQRPTLIDDIFRFNLFAAALPLCEMSSLTS